MLYCVQAAAARGRGAPHQSGKERIAMEMKDAARDILARDRAGEPVSLDDPDYGVINAIIEQTGVQIDIEDDGFVSICGTEKEGMDKAAKLIYTIVTDFEAGQVFEGKVVSIKEFGAFLEFAPGKEGLVHISKISKKRVDKVEDVLQMGDVVKAVCLGKDKMGRFSFSIRDVDE